MSSDPSAAAPRLIACLGKFDALHRGHRALVERAAALGRPLLLGFSGMAEVLGWQARVPVVAEEDRARVLAGWPGAPQELRLPFAEVRGLDAAGFVTLLAQRGVTGIVTGADFRGGRDRGQDAEAFAAAAAAAGLTTAIVAAVASDGTAVSSTRVREALGRGAVDVAASLLGRPHRVIGQVGRGDGRGRTIGVPTANLTSVANLIPGSGVYACRAWLAGRSHLAAVNIGRAPTIAADRPASVEAHLIGWSGDCYGQELALDVLARIRDERRFADLAALTAQIRADIAAVAMLSAATPAD